MELTINSLKITGFKGIRDAQFDLNGHSAIISGRNGTGKTSVCDAFLWLLFGKDSAGKATDPKPLDSDGNRITGLESEVCASLTAGGTTVELKRQLYEVWSKDPTSGEKVYSRDETLCWIDDVPKKLEKEYAPFVLSLVGESETLFKLLSELGAFMRLNWVDRRRELVKIAGGDAEAELLRMPEYADVERILAGASIEDAKKRLLEQRKLTDRALKLIPARIDELEKTLQPLDEKALDKAQSELVALEARKADIDAQLAPSEEALQRMNDLYTAKRKLEDTLRSIELDLKKPLLDALLDAEGRLSAQRHTGAALHADKLAYEDRLQRAHAALDKLKQRREQKLATYHDLMNQPYEPPEIATICPTCGQELPQERIAEAVAKHRDEWNAKHQADIDEIKQGGTELKQQIAELTAEADKAQADLNSTTAQIAHLPDPSALTEEIARLREASPDLEGSDEWRKAKAHLEQTDAAIAAQGSDEQRDELKRKRTDLETAIGARRAALAQKETDARIRARMAELVAQKRELGAQAAAIEGDIDLLARYARARCTALEAAINKHFHAIRWRMFDTAKNGSMIDCCDAIVDGVAYSSDSHKLNNGACINADVEIIRVLSNAYGVTVPCFIDNAESVNTIGYPGGQRVLLRVTDEPQLTLTIED